MFNRLKTFWDRCAFVLGVIAAALAAYSTLLDNQSATFSTIYIFSTELAFFALGIFVFLIRKSLFEPKPVTFRRGIRLLSLILPRLLRQQFKGFDRVLASAALVSFAVFTFALLSYFAIVSWVFYRSQSEIYYPRMMIVAKGLEDAERIGDAAAAYRELAASYPDDRRTPDIIERANRLESMKRFAKIYYKRPLYPENLSKSAERYYNVLTACNLDRSSFPCSGILSSYLDIAKEALDRIQDEESSCERAIPKVVQQAPWLLLDPVDAKFAGIQDLRAKPLQVCRLLNLQNSKDVELYLRRRWLISEVSEWIENSNSAPYPSEGNFFD